jgi:NOL1/NOP2/sun family putative RNA methylase
MKVMLRGKTCSIGEVKRRLPHDFLESLSAEFPPNLTDRIFHGMGARRATTLRVNTLRWDAGAMMRFFRQHAVKHRRTTWYPDAFVLADARERDVEGWDPYREGRLYMQNLSSMVPALALAPRQGEAVLDIAAAPGSKTTQMAALMANSGFILANESNPIRAERLRYNLRMQGCAIAEVRLGRGESLGGEMPGRFDRVLLDAPCSGEGRFTMAHPATYRSWSPRTVKECAKLQRKLLSSGALALKPGGVLEYSTCTLNREENERMVDWAMENLPLAIESPQVQVPGAMGGIAEGLHKAVGNAVRILPNREFEGFFLCRFRKKA